MRIRSDERSSDKLLGVDALKRGGATIAQFSAVNDSHARFVMTLACGRREVIQPCHLLSAQFDANGGRVLLYAGDPLGARDRGDVMALREQPGKSDLRRGCARFGGDGLDLIDDA